MEFDVSQVKRGIYNLTLTLPDGQVLRRKILK
jgi:hypothetical protein